MCLLIPLDGCINKQVRLTLRVTQHLERRYVTRSHQTRVSLGAEGPLVDSVVRYSRRQPEGQEAVSRVAVDVVDPLGDTTS